MLEISNKLIDEVVADIQLKSKYHFILPEVIRNIAIEEAQKRNNFKEINKATRTRLHQIAGAYVERKINYSTCIEELIKTKENSKQEFLESSLKIMRLHASTEERIPILSDFYRIVLEDIGPIESILDLACGLNPLSIPWIPFCAEYTYFACEIFLDMIKFLNEYFSFNSISGTAFGCDLTREIPKVDAQVTFLLKTIPLLDQTDRSLARNIISQVKTKFVVVSFPIKSLSGRNVGMTNTYKNRFEEIVEGLEYAIKSFEFSNELVYLIEK